MPDRSPVRLLLVAVAVTLAGRGLLIALSSDAFAADPDAYRALATTLADTGVFGLTAPDGSPRPTAFRPPLYPLLLSFLVADGQLPAWRVAALHLVLAAATCLLTFCAAVRLTRDRRAADSSPRGPGSRPAKLAAGRLPPPFLALAASTLVAVDPILLSQSTEIMTETLATCLAAAALWLWALWTDSDSKADPLVIAVLLGTTLGLAYLCRPTFLVWGGFVVVASVWTAGTRRRRWAAACVAGILVLTVSGWTVRNVRALGHPIWATSHGGYTLLLANNESFYDHLRDAPIGTVWHADAFLDAYQHRYEADPREASFWSTDWDSSSSEPASVTVTEYGDDQLCAQAALATIERRPAMFLWSSIVRAGRLWSPLPHGIRDRSSGAILAVGCYYLLLYGFVILAVVRHRRVVFKRPWWAGWLLIFSLTAVHAVYWSNLRMRAPAMPALAILCVLAALPRTRTPVSSSQNHEPTRH